MIYSEIKIDIEVLGIVPGRSADLFGGLLGDSVVKSLPTVQETPSSIPGSGRSPREGNGNPLQYSHLENPMDRGAWQATVHGVSRSWTQLKFVGIVIILEIACEN